MGQPPSPDAPVRSHIRIVCYSWPTPFDIPTASLTSLPHDTPRTSCAATVDLATCENDVRARKEKGLAITKSCHASANLASGIRPGSQVFDTGGRGGLGVAGKALAGSKDQAASLLVCFESESIFLSSAISFFYAIPSVTSGPLLGNGDQAFQDTGGTRGNLAQAGEAKNAGVAA